MFVEQPLASPGSANYTQMKMINLSPPPKNMNFIREACGTVGTPAVPVFVGNLLATAWLCLFDVAWPQDFRDQVNVYQLFFVSYQMVWVGGAAACAIRYKLINIWNSQKNHIQFVFHRTKRFRKLYVFLNTGESRKVQKHNNNQIFPFPTKKKFLKKPQVASQWNAINGRSK